MILCWWLNVHFVSCSASELAAPLRTWGAWAKCIKFQKYQWVPMVFLGRKTWGYVAGQLGRCADELCVYCSSFAGKLKTTCFTRHTKIPTEVLNWKEKKKGENKQTKNNTLIWQIYQKCIQAVFPKLLQQLKIFWVYKNVLLAVFIWNL